MPEVNFEVRKGLTVPRGTAAVPSVVFDPADLNTGLYSPGADQVAISTNGSGRLFVDASGNVGVNTGTPSTYGRLAVVDSQNGFLSSTFVNTSSGSGAVNRIQIGNDASSGAGQLVVYGSQHSTLPNIFDINNATNASLRLLTNNTERVRVTSAGLVGIGTSSPSQLFHVSGTGGGSFTSGYTNALARINATTNTAGQGAALALTALATKETAWIISAEHTSGNNGDLAFYGYPGGASYSEFMRLTSTGRLGIGTTGPLYRLQVSHSASAVCFGESSSVATVIGTNAAGNASQELSLRGFPLTFTGNGGAGSEAARIDSSGRLLVGTSSSASAGQLAAYSRLQVMGNTASEAGVLSIARNEAASGIAADENLGFIAFVDSAGNDYAWIQASADGNAGTNDYPGRLVFSVTADGASSPTEAMRIKNTRVINFANAPTYADNTAALAGGLVAGDVYRKSDGTLMITY